MANTTQKEKMVTITLPILPNENENADVYVSVNDRNWQIVRGEEVEVPECVAEAIRNSEKQKLAAIKYRKNNERK